MIQRLTGTTVRLNRTVRRCALLASSERCAATLTKIAAVTPTIELVDLGAFIGRIHGLAYTASWAEFLLVLTDG